MRLKLYLSLSGEISNPVEPRQVMRLVTSIPSRQEQLLILAEAWLLIAKEDLKTAWRNEEFKNVLIG
jgi:hypothetical protein